MFMVSCMFEDYTCLFVCLFVFIGFVVVQLLNKTMRCHFCKIWVVTWTTTLRHSYNHFCVGTTSGLFPLLL